MTARRRIRRRRPRASRPRMPEYGIVGARSGRGLLPWRWARQRLERAHTYWLATSRPDGRPHAMPVWGIWLDDRFYFSTGRKSRKARNLAADPRCVVAAEQKRESVIVEGVAAEVTDAAEMRRAGVPYKSKYKYALDPSLGPIFAVRPRVVFGFIDRGQEFVRTATRWRFASRRR